MKRNPPIKDTGSEYQTCGTATDDYDHGNHHLARATIRLGTPGLVARASLSALALSDINAHFVD